MEKKYGVITTIAGNLISVKFEHGIIQNELGYVVLGKKRLKSEVVKINRNIAFMQVFESTQGIKIGDKVEFTGEMLSVQLGPGLLSQIYDGLQNPLPKIAHKFNFFLQRGIELNALDFNKKWDFVPTIKSGEAVKKGSFLGYVQEGIFKHFIMVPFDFRGTYIVEKIVEKGNYPITHTIAILKSKIGNKREVSMVFNWPIKIPIVLYKQRYSPVEPLSTKVRIIDTFFPIAKGGTYCIPGPFGAGKTVLQQLTSRYAEVDIVIIAACGERASEIVETLKEFPEIIDSRTGKSLMERTIIICNTSAMPVAAREASIYTATTLGEYYRQMGLNILLLADSTSRWAQALRELSGRLEEIPGEEAYPAYLESRIAEFYERAGFIELENGKKGSLTIGGTVSPAGGNFEEPVTQATLKVVGAFHGLSRERAEARKFPSIHFLESWSKYKGFIEPEMIQQAKYILVKGDEIDQMMKVIGEEGTSMEDYIVYLKADFLDSVYLQQDGFDKIDAATSQDRQKYVFSKNLQILKRKFKFKNKQETRDAFYKLRQLFSDWNYTSWNSSEFEAQEKKINEFINQIEEKYEKNS